MKTAGKQRQQLFRIAADEVQRMAEEAAQARGEDFVVLLLDLRHETPRLIAEGLKLDTASILARSIQKSRQQRVPTVVAYVSKEIACGILSALSSPHAEDIRRHRLPKGVFWTCTFAFGGHGLAGVPFRRGN